VNLPAYWIYKAMGGAYKNVGTLLPNLSTDASGIVNKFNSFLSAGDELVNVNNGNIYWVIESGINGDLVNTAKRIVDRTGNRVTGLSATVKVIRSGYRNMLTPPATSIVCLNNPIKTAGGTKYVSFSRFEDLTDMKVLTASATVYDDDWGVKIPCPTCPDGYTLSADGENCVAQPIENTSQCFTLCAGFRAADYGKDGAAIYGSLTPRFKTSLFWGGDCSGCQSGPSTPVTPVAPGCERMNTGPNTCTTTECGRLVSSGVWLCTSTAANDWAPIGEWIAIEKTIYFPTEKDYYIGYSCDNLMRVLIANDPEDTPVLWQALDNINYKDDYYKTWYVKPFHFTAGYHKIRIEVLNPDGPGTVGLEVYNDSYSQLIFPTGDPSILFSTANLLYDPNVQVYRDARGANIPRFTCPGGRPYNFISGSACKIPVNKAINPYVTGFRGNWRTYKNEVFQINRKYDNLFNTEPLGLNIKNAGYFESFSSFFTNNGTKWNRSTNPQWVTANTITLYDKYGQELENKDALCRYSAATFAFRGDQSAAVASNAKNREIYSESFEDYRFRTGCGSSGVESCDPLFKIGGSSNLLANTRTTSHSGNYAIELTTDGMTLNTKIHNTKVKGSNDPGVCKDIDEANEFKYLTSNKLGEFTPKGGTGIYPTGFEPSPDKKYVFSAWVKDNSPQSTSPGITATVNGASVTLTKKAVVEKWKLVEGTFDIAAGANNTALTIQVKGSGSTVLLDDLRIHPFDAHMKTYAYDDKTLRLMAEMDENNFATFYEYDDEGNLVRVKKETERGIMTIKENRSSYRKRPLTP
jgi:hypothetical protein